MRFVRSLARTLLGWLLLFSLPVFARDYRFDGSMSEEVLRSYLSRSMTTMYLVEFDNYGRSRRPGEAGQGRFWVWGWDEITWFSQQPEKDRNEWLGYAWNWVREHDPDGYVQMPGMRIISGAGDGKRWYDVNQASAATPNGFGQEQTIRAIWTTDANSAPVKRPCIRELSARGSADFSPLQREQANEFGLSSRSRGTGDIEAP